MPRQGLSAVLGAAVTGAALSAAVAHAQAPKTAPGRCAAFTAVRIPAARIGLATRGARVTSARWMVASPESEHPTPDYCRILGAIAPIDPKAPEIRFELDLPAHWNGKALMLGGGGFDGFIPDTSGPLLGEPAPTTAPPLMRGYATFGGDSGHQAANKNLPTPAVDGAFALNDEALQNYAGDALKKTRDAAVALIARRYGRRPARTYFAGGSNGGREALVAVHRWPADFDGAIAAYPFWRAGTNALAFGVVSRAMAAAGAYPDPAKRMLVQRAAVAACDSLDGLKDGLVANVEACRFDPATLRCPGGGDSGDDCLSDAQIAALKTYASPFTFSFRPRATDRIYPGFTVLAGAEIGDAAQLGTAAPSFPPRPAMPLAAHFWDQMARYAIARDPAFNSLSLDPQHPGPYAKRLERVVELLDAKPGGLSAFYERGGKLILYHGLADPLVSYRSTADYWRGLQAEMGDKAVQRFSRFYVAPGFGHGAGAFLPVWDPLSVLEAWRERGSAPGRIVATDASEGGAGRSRPLCPYPAWPRYNGRGDPRLAASFSCRLSAEGD